jgi:hypothetical protein
LAADRSSGGWRPSPAPRAEPDGPWYAVREHRSEVRPSRRVSEAEAAEILAGRDHVLADLIAQAGPMRLRRLRTSPHFAALVRTIASLGFNIVVCACRHSSCRFQPSSTARQTQRGPYPPIAVSDRAARASPARRPVGQPWRRRSRLLAR